MLTQEQIREAMESSHREAARQAILSEPTVSSSNEAEEFFKISNEYPDLIEQCAVRIPTRPTEGINPKLAICLTVWARAGAHWDPMVDDHGGFMERTRERSSLTS